jgi:precorrin-6B methylase 1
VTPASGLWLTADHFMGGRLAETVLSLRDGGCSPQTISDTLKSNGVHASRVTIINWLRTLDTEAAA